MKKNFLALLALFLLPFSAGFAQCNPDDQVESWYSYLKSYGNSGIDYFPIPESDEMIVGDSVHLEMSKQFEFVKKYADQARLDAIISRLSAFVNRKNIRYKVHVIDDKRTLNAFSVAGGHLYITTKMVEWTESEDELAFILAHEMAHVDNKHGIRKVQIMMLGQTFLGDYGTMAGNIALAVTAPFGQIDEYEADREGAMLAEKAGYDSKKGLRFFEKMGEKENYDIVEKIVRTHPYSKERLHCMELFLKDEYDK